MKSVFFLCCIILNSICFGQSDSLKEPMIDLTLHLINGDFNLPIDSAKIIIVGSNGDQVVAYTDSTGTIEFTTEKNTVFLKAGNTYTVEIEGELKQYLSTSDFISTVGVTSNTRLVREYKLIRICYRPFRLPSLRIKGLLTEIDSSSQDSLNYLNAIMIENPTIVISITSLFEHEKDITPFWRRSKTIQARLIEMGIPKERLIIKIATYSEQTDPIIRERKGGNVIFSIESFDYVPTPP